MIQQLGDAFQVPIQRFESDDTKIWEVPDVFLGVSDRLFLSNGESVISTAKQIGLVFSGGPAPGGHDIIAGILMHLRSQDQLLGFCGGFGGLLKGQYKPIQTQDLPRLKGASGFDYLGTDRTKIVSVEQYSMLESVLMSLNIDVLLVVGGDDSNTNAIHLAKALMG